MSGGKGGSSTQKVEIPKYIEEAAKRNLTKAEAISQLGYVPYYGPDVAAFTPMQQAGFQNTADVAGAFGMAAPTSQRDIMGGMGAPTEYAGGVMGYSSQPMYQQSLDQFAAARPAQKDYIDSFFIDPKSGEYAYKPFNYTQMRPEGQADAADEEYLMDQYGPDLDGPGGLASPTGGYTGLGDMFDGGGPGYSGAAYGSGGGKEADKDGDGYISMEESRDLDQSNISNISNAVSGIDPGGDGGDGGNKVICTALHDLGILPDDIYNLDVEFGQRVNVEDLALGNGYRAWATPVAEYIKGDSLGSKVVRAVVAPIAKSWAAQMAHVMRPEEYKPNICGRLIMAVGHPICRLIGTCLTAKTKEA